LAVDPADRARLYQSMLTLSAHAKPAHIGLKARDIVAAVVVFVLVSVTAIPGVVPFLLIENPEIALRVSNLVLILLLFFVGYWWGHYTDARPIKVGATVMFLGVFMVLVAVALGG